MNKKVLILCWRATDHNLSFEDKKERESYEIFSKMAKEKNIDLFLSGLAFFHNCRFTSSICFNGKGWICKKNVSPDLIYNRIYTDLSNADFKEKIEKDIPIINPSLFNLLCDNKYLNYLLFSDYYPKSFLVSNREEIRKKLNQIRTDRFVVKPNIGSWGHNVKILSKKKVGNIDLGKKFFLMQEFIDSARGIPGLIKGLHEIRITIVGQNISYAYIRTPKRGSLLCNMARGGKMQNIEVKEIPKSMKTVCKKVMRKLSSFTSLIYSVDLSLDKDGKAKIIEMNSRPGLYFYPKDKEKQCYYYNHIMDNFIDYLKKSENS